MGVAGGGGGREVKVGLELIDLMFRIENRFGIGLRQAEFEPFLREQGDFTAGALHDFVCAALRRRGMPLPDDGWDRIRSALADALGVPVERVRQDSRFMRDLGGS